MCNGHTVNTWLTPSLLGLQYQSTVDLRSYLQIQLDQLRINHQCQVDAPVWTYALYKLFACYSGSGAGLLTQPRHASVAALLLNPAFQSPGLAWLTHCQTVSMCLLSSGMTSSL